MVGRGCVEGWSACSVEDVPPDLVCDVGIKSVGFPASRVPVAAEIDVTVSLDEVELEHAHCGDVIVERGVDVPSHQEAGAVGVEEDNC